MSRIETQPELVRRLPAMLGEAAIDPADWTAEELASANDWVFELSRSDVAEIDGAIAAAEARGLDIMEIGIEDFPLPALDAKLAALKHQLMDGRGVALLRGLPVERLGAARTAMAYWGMGLRVGEPVSQNAKGHLLGHVADLVGAHIKTPSHRGYQTNATMHYHCDSCDVAALLCVHKAKSGGMTMVASSTAIHNEMVRRRPDLARAGRRVVPRLPRGSTAQQEAVVRVAGVQLRRQLSGGELAGSIYPLGPALRRRAGILRCPARGDGAPDFSRRRAVVRCSPR